MRYARLLSAVLLSVATATAAPAATYNLGDVTNGVTTSRILTVQTVDFLNFSLSSNGGTYLSTLDISVTSRPGSNFRPIIGLYSGTTLVASHDSGVSGGTAVLSFSGLNVPTFGAYTLGVGAWKSTFGATLSNVSSTAFFNNGTYTVNIGTTISPVPLPAGGVLLLSGLATFALLRRRRKSVLGGHAPV